MSNLYRLKHSFTAGELSPEMHARLDFDRYVNGCSKQLNMISLSQGPATRRPGLRFIYDLNSIGLDAQVGEVRLIPFIFNEYQAYVMIFFRHTDGSVRLVFGTNEGLVVYGATPPSECPPGSPITPVPSPGDIVSLTLPDEWNVNNFDWAQTADEMYIAQSGLNPHIIKRHSHECWELVSVTFTDQPDDWSDENGWPETVTFHQQRLIFGGNRIKRQTIWTSMAGDFSSFHRDNTNLTDDMAIVFTLDSGTQNKIQWLASGKALYVGTLGDEWTVKGNTQSALTPENILSQKQTNLGSVRLKPQIINFTTIYLTTHARTVNEFVYDYVYDGYKSNDLTILAPHLTRYNSIIDWSYQQTPHGIIWCVRSDGDLIGLTYQRQHKVVGWHHHDTDGKFVSVATIPGLTREDDTWFIVQREIENNMVYYLEKMEDYFDDRDLDSAKFLDSFSEYLGTPVNKISGLDHLEGKIVHIFADSTVHPPVPVIQGTITLNNYYSHLVVGLPFESEIWPLVSDVPLRDGTTFSRMSRVVKINIDLFMSLGLYYGKLDSEDGEYEEEIPFRLPSDRTGEPVPLFSGIKTIDFPPGFDRDIRYFIRQKQPLPLTVRGVVDIVEVNN